jgi:biotin carboxyl carrier protein
MADTTESFLVKVNNFEFTMGKEEAGQFDIIKRSPSHYNIIHKESSVNVMLIGADHKKIRVEIEGQSFDVEIRDNLDLMLDKMGFSAVAAKQIREIKAPMPGLVLDIVVTEGQEVKEGEKILILEAMKMENSIMIVANAVIKKILVKPGQAVEKGQVLVELD